MVVVPVQLESAVFEDGTLSEGRGDQKLVSLPDSAQAAAGDEGEAEQHPRTPDSLPHFEPL